MENDGFNAIQLAALGLFASNSYEGVSMFSISEAAGVKKPTIYSHFTGKSGLYLSLIGPCIRIESARLREALEGAGGVMDKLRAYFDGFCERFCSDPPYLRFLMRALRLPPPELRERTERICEEHYSVMEETLASFMAPLAPKKLSVSELAKAYLSLLDGAQLELVGGCGKSGFKARCLWPLFEEAAAGGRAS
ncbi:MAG: TetR/AcrR family transcriptional regulator [Deltaproteobacteria bacterium]|jgi:AcrR family transcriptional regulator|nr:TetR/AcrR family transcriptional regulator [Deltaproteobacteria bacterium]